MRIGEFLALRRIDLRGGIFHVERTTHEGKFLDGTKNDHGEPVPGRDMPCPPTLERLIRALPARIDTDLMFPTPTGKVWREGNWRKTVWKPTQKTTKLDIRPHKMRHSYVSHLRAAGIDDADLAQIAGHTVETMLSTYTHPVGQSFAKVRQIIG
jgi:integrase